MKHAVGIDVTRDRTPAWKIRDPLRCSTGGRLATQRLDTSDRPSLRRGHVALHRGRERRSGDVPRVTATARCWRPKPQCLVRGALFSEDDILDRGWSTNSRWSGECRSTRKATPFELAPAVRTGPRSGRSIQVIVLSYGAAFVALTLVSLLRQSGVSPTNTVWAEDGTIFYGQALAHPFLVTLFTPYAGYFQLFPRLTFGLLSILPPADIAASAAIVVPRPWPVSRFLCSTRSGGLILHLRQVAAY